MVHNFNSVESYLKTIKFKSRLSLLINIIPITPGHFLVWRKRKKCDFGEKESRPFKRGNRFRPSIRSFLATVCCTRCSVSRSRPTSGPRIRKVAAVRDGGRTSAAGRRTVWTEWKTPGGRPPVWWFSTWSRSRYTTSPTPRGWSPCGAGRRAVWQTNNKKTNRAFQTWSPRGREILKIKITVSPYSVLPAFHLAQLEFQRRYVILQHSHGVIVQTFVLVVTVRRGFQLQNQMVIFSGRYVLNNNNNSSLHRNYTEFQIDET